jgi:hypothetical protein
MARIPHNASSVPMNSQERSAPRRCLRIAIRMGRESPFLYSSPEWLNTLPRQRKERVKNVKAGCLSPKLRRSDLLTVKRAVRRGRITLARRGRSSNCLSQPFDIFRKTVVLRQNSVAAVS